MSFNIWHSPSNAHAYRLLIVKELGYLPLPPSCQQQRDGIMYRSLILVNLSGLLLSPAV
jgi:hypothetical protein